MDAAYRKLGIEGVSAGPGSTLQDMIDKLAQVPLEFSPGTAWNYSHSTDVVGYLVEVISGQRLDRYLQEQIFEPLGMTDTAFWVRPEQAERLGSTYAAAPSGDGIEVVDDAASSPFLEEPTFLRAAPGWSRRPGTTCASAGCCSATARLTARASSGARPSS